MVNQQIWMNPESGQQLTLCPWLELIPNQTASDSNTNKYGCKIYLDRPEDCRHYPTTIDEMSRDDCEMLEVIDLKNTKLAQQKLDRLMSDSRPPAS